MAILILGCSQRVRDWSVCNSVDKCMPGLSCVQSRCTSVDAGSDGATGGSGGIGAGGVAGHDGGTGGGGGDGVTGGSGDRADGADGLGCTCTQAGLPLCNPATRACVQCLTGADCPSGKTVCDPTSNSCVQCLGASDCAAPRPACDPVAKACVGCLKNTDCSGARPVCDTSATSCVQCLVSRTDCAGKTPICDAKACRSCRSDQDCVTALGADPGVCMPDGHCTSAAEVVYAVTPPVGSCGAADGTLAKPYCTAQAAVDQARGGTKPVVVLRGDFSGISATVTTTAVTVVGQNATINPVASNGIDVSGTANLTVRDLTITGGTSMSGAAAHVSGTGASLTLTGVKINGNAGAGVVAEAGSFITMDRCVVKGAGGLASPAALKTTASAFHVTNSVFASSSSGATLDPSVPAGGDQVFKNNTIVGNGTGLGCVGSFATGLIFSGNTSDASPGCTPPACCTGDPLLTADYHLMSTSPCIDRLTFDPQVPDDLFTTSRPQGPKSDCGAAELTP